MRIDPTLARLQADPAPLILQSKAVTAALHQWQRTAGHGVLQDLAQFGAGAPLEELTSLARLMAADGAGPVLTLLRDLCSAIATSPLGQPEMPASRSDAAMVLTLAQSGRATMALVVGAPTSPSRPLLSSATFGDGQLHLIVLAGSAEADIVARPVQHMPARRESCSLEKGTHLALSLDHQALNLMRIDKPLVMLRLHRASAAPEVEQQIDLASGALIGQSAADPRESRIELAMALLERMGRADAAPIIASLAMDGSLSRRWQALRHALALDSAAGFAALCAVGEKPSDPLCGHARSLVEALVAQHPILARLSEDSLCPA